MLKGIKKTWIDLSATAKAIKAVELNFMKFIFFEISEYLFRKYSF